MLRNSAAVLLLSLLTSGCGTQFAYDNLDRFVRWSVDDYVTLSAEQDRYLDAELAVVLHIHRTTELPRYASALREWEAQLGDGSLSREELAAMEAEVMQWGERLAESGLPLMTNVLYSTTGAQREELARTMPHESAKFVRPLIRRSIDERRERWQRETEDQLEYLIGRLTKPQKASIAGFATRYQPDEELWLEYRANWQAELLATLGAAPSYADFASRFRMLVLHREQWFTEAYAAAFASNQQVYRDLAVSAFGSLDTRQRSAFSKRLLELAEDFEQLAAKAGPTPPPPSCFVGCGLSWIDRYPGNHIADQHDRRQAETRQHRCNTAPERTQIEMPCEPGDDTAHHRPFGVAAQRAAS